MNPTPVKCTNPTVLANSRQEPTLETDVAAVSRSAKVETDNAASISGLVNPVLDTEKESISFNLESKNPTAQITEQSTMTNMNTTTSPSDDTSAGQLYWNATGLLKKKQIRTCGFEILHSMFAVSGMCV